MHTPSNNCWEHRAHCERCCWRFMHSSLDILLHRASSLYKSSIIVHYIHQMFVFFPSCCHIYCRIFISHYFWNWYKVISHTPHQPNTGMQSVNMHIPLLSTAVQHHTTPSHIAHTSFNVPIMFRWRITLIFDMFWLYIFLRGDTKCLLMALLREKRPAAAALALAQRKVPALLSSQVSNTYDIRTPYRTIS